MCPDFHGALNLVSPSGCYQFPRTSFRSFVMASVSLSPTITPIPGLLRPGNPQPLQHRSGPALISGLQLGITERLSCLCSLAHQPAHSASVLTLYLPAQGFGGAGNFIRPLRSGFMLRIGRAVNRVCFNCFYLSEGRPIGHRAPCAVFAVVLKIGSRLLLRWVHYTKW